MKRLILILIGLLAAGVCFAEPPGMVQFSDASIQTNNSTLATQTPDSDGYVYGWIDTVIVDITAGASTTNTIVLSTLASQGTGAARTILTLSDVATDGVYPVRDLVTGVTGSDISNVPARIPLLQDKLRLTATMAGDETNDVATTMDVYVILSPTP